MRVLVGFSGNLEIVLQFPYFPTLGKNLAQKMHLTFGGTSINVSLLLRQFGFDPLLFLPVGKDSFLSDLLIERLQKTGIDFKVFPVKEGGSLAVIVTTPQGNQILGYKAPYLTYQPLEEAIVEELKNKPQAVIATGVVLPELPLIKILFSAHSSQVIRVLNPRAEMVSHLKWDQELRKKIDLLFVNEKEVQALIDNKGVSEKSLERLKKMEFKKAVIVTCGRKGVYLVTPENIIHQPAFPPKEVVDPTGAGDAFLGGFIASYLEKKPLAECARIGAASASLQVSRPGGLVYLTKKEVEEFLKQAG